MPTVNEVFQYLDKFAPVELKQSYDNVGLLVGRGGREVSKILVALDITGAVIGEARTYGAELIVSHHPVLLDGLKSVTDENADGLRVVSLIEQGIAAICMHTNLDTAVGGVNDVLAARVGLKDVSYLFAEWIDEGDVPHGIARRGILETPMPLKTFAESVKRNLGCGGVKIVDGGRECHRVAVCGGAGGSYLESALAAGCDTLVTSEVKYYRMLVAKEKGLNIIDAGHFPTEDVICPALVEILSGVFPEVEIRKAASLADPAEYIC